MYEHMLFASKNSVKIIYNIHCKLLKKRREVIDWFRYSNYEYFIDESLRKLESS